MASRTMNLAGHRLLIDGKQFIHDEHDQSIFVEIMGERLNRTGKWFILSNDGSKREITDRPIKVLSNPSFHKSMMFTSDEARERFYNSEIIVVKED